MWPAGRHVLRPREPLHCSNMQPIQRTPAAPVLAAGRYKTVLRFPANTLVMQGIIDGIPWIRTGVLSSDPFPNVVIHGGQRRAFYLAARYMGPRYVADPAPGAPPVGCDADTRAGGLLPELRWCPPHLVAGSARRKLSVPCTQLWRSGRRVYS